MTVEDLRNTKIYLSNEDDRIKFQEKVFKLGVTWNGGDDDTHITHLDNCFYYIDGHFNLTVDYSNDTSFFKNDASEQIFLDDVLSIKKPKEECKFKPFDKVLVRNTEDDKWKPREYASLDASDKFGLVYGTTDGCYRKYCIPYEGNEHLANTTKNLEQ